MSKFNYRKFLFENKLTATSKALVESMSFDADDYIPFEDLKIGDKVWYLHDPGSERLIIRAKEKNNVIIVAPESDMEDVRFAIYDEDVIAHRSENYESEEEEELDELEDNELPYRLEVYVNNQLKFTETFDSPEEAKSVAFDYMKDPKATTASFKIFRIGEENECIYENSKGEFSIGRAFIEKLKKI